MDLEITPTLKIPAAELRLSFARSSGPGGQNVNKVSSKAILHFDVTTSPSLPPDVRARFLATYGSRVTNSGEIVIHSEEFRDQPKNIEASLGKLREMILAVLKPPKKRRPTKPTRGSKVRRLKEKKSRSQVKEGRRYRGSEG
jgi:ribosome-associated protein